MSDPDREASSPAAMADASPAASAAAAAAGPEHEDEQANSLPPFEPFFTLLTNTTTNATVHPRVHYLFSDDDASVLTTPQTDPSHRALVVDLAAPTAPGGNWSVSWASSLSPDFAVTGSHLSVPQHGGGSSCGAGAAVLLCVEGVERDPVAVAHAVQPGDSLPSSGSGPVGREDLEGLADNFRRRMGVLNKVVGEGEKRRDVLGRQQGEEIYPGEDAVGGAEAERKDGARENE